MKTKKLLNCKFTDEEMRQFGITLAQEAQRKERLEDAKKQSASQFKADIDAVDAQIRSLSQKLARGSEDRYVDCDVFFNSPEEGKKTIVRTDTGETLSVSPMTEDELQDLFINELGARKEEHEFVFRDKSRCKLVSLDEFHRICRGGGGDVPALVRPEFHGEGACRQQTGKFGFCLDCLCGDFGRGSV